ncbi:transmembrane protein, putative (macronuclear) [Tetrahymena thermophila SB210]|uniref:Transmembrane protein, putative n=1 Tax=Tetrahymena thermophila (strain SB210) TaxID=312017 RepID=I7M6C8_TETTS|nr:transmembrane protein, putative [Tetrahymena thermophila SB210]EAR84972.2 transmembrane protein, putative [Tetrahymena thermophila SB210]|eukprot:XP_001032635.2 transmembrane protein, putative [Tetrahymena thermophila SB210]
MSQKTQSNVFLQQRNIIKCELSSEILQQFRTIFDEKLNPDLFKQKKIKEIYQIITENLTDEVLSKYLIAVVLNPVYNINYEEGHVLIVNYERIGLFCYKPKYIDLSLPQNVQAYDKDTIKKMESYAKLVEITDKESFENDKFLKEYLSAYYVKNYVKLDTDLDQYELKFINDIRDAFIIASGMGFWHIFLGEKIVFDKELNSKKKDIKGSLPKRESLIDLSYQFDQNKKKRILAISQQSNKPSFFQMTKIGWTQLFILALLFLILFLALGCEEFKIKKQSEIDFQIKEYQQKMKLLKEEQEESYFFQSEENTDESKFEFVPKLSPKIIIMDGVCYLRNELIILSMIIVFAYFGTSLFKNRQKFRK